MVDGQSVFFGFGVQQSHGHRKTGLYVVVFFYLRFFIFFFVFNIKLQLVNMYYGAHGVWQNNAIFVEYAPVKSDRCHYLSMICFLSI